MNPKFSIVVKKYKYTCGKCDFKLPFYCRFLVRCTFAIALQLATQKCCSLFLLLHPYAQHCIPSLPISFSFSNLYLVCFQELSTSAENVPEKSANFYCWCAFWLYRYVTRTNVSFFDPSPNDQRTEHSCAYLNITI